MKNWAKKRSLTKALLESLSSTKSGLDLYIDYFEKTQLSDPSSEVGPLFSLETNYSKTSI